MLNQKIFDNRNRCKKSNLLRIFHQRYIETNNVVEQIIFV